MVFSCWSVSICDFFSVVVVLLPVSSVYRIVLVFHYFPVKCGSQYASLHIHVGGQLFRFVREEIAFCCFSSTPMGKQKRQQGLRAKFTEYFQLNCVLKCWRRAGGCINGME